jgi:hypothetical protein
MYFYPLQPFFTPLSILPQRALKLATFSADKALKELSVFKREKE